jgi:hypothetical protein
MAKNIFINGPKLAKFFVFFGVFTVGIHFAYALYDLGAWRIGSMMADVVIAAVILWSIVQMTDYKKIGWIVNCTLGVLMLVRGLGVSISVSTEFTFFQVTQPYISLIVGLVFIASLIPLKKIYFTK